MRKTPSSKSLPEIVPTGETPDSHWREVVALCYRTTRALLRGRRLLGEGQSIASAAANTRFLLRQAFPIDPSDPVVGPLADQMPAGTPTAPFPDLDDHTEAVSGLHVFTAIELGVDPDDEKLFWFEAKRILETFPPLEALIDFEEQLITFAGKKLASTGKAAAQKAIELVFGKLAYAEKADFARLPYAYLATFGASTPVEDRALMVARLEQVARQASQSLDIRTQLAALRSIAQIQGLTFQDTDQEKRNFGDVLSLPAVDRDAPPPRVPKLPASVDLSEEDSA